MYKKIECRLAILLICAIIGCLFFAGPALADAPKPIEPPISEIREAVIEFIRGFSPQLAEQIETMIEKRQELVEKILERIRPDKPVPPTPATGIIGVSAAP